jgi:uncharacterized protein
MTAHDTIAEKLTRLRDMIRQTGGCAVAYSGGVDSSLLVAVGSEVLGERCLAVIAVSSTYPKREYAPAIKRLEEAGIPHVVIESEELDIPGFADNPPDRCYFCKRELFGKVKEAAGRHGISIVVDGTNADDPSDFRPGMRAARELGVLSPFLACGITKEEIREISREVYGLETADKPSMACMSSRVPYGSRITRKKLGQIEEMEDFLFERGFRVFRARHHGTILRLEAGRQEMEYLRSGRLKEEIVKKAKEIGFVYVTIDLEGFRSGSMNETLARSDR